MARGGTRRGAGRKKGSKSPKTVAREKAAERIALKALEEGTTPLEVMLEAMREAYRLGGAIAAAPLAKECAPYIHPKLSTVEAKLDGSLGHYEALPIPVEQRNPLGPVARAAGAAVAGGAAA